MNDCLTKTLALEANCGLSKANEVHIKSLSNIVKL